MNPAAADEADGHVPVMLQEVLEALAPHREAIYVDGTFGAGSYSRALLDAAACTVWGIDRDPDAVGRGVALARRYPERFQVIEGCFGDMDRLIEAEGAAPVDGVALDLGVSSMQIAAPERGFSFQADGPLDMRMSGPAGDFRSRYSQSSLRRRCCRVVEQEGIYQLCARRLSAEALVEEIVRVAVHRL